MVGVDESRQDEHPGAAELLRARVVASQLVAFADGGHDPVADRDGAARERRRRGRGEQDIAVDQQVGHVPGR